MKKKVDEELAKKEIETVLYWKGEMEKILAKRPESLATFPDRGPEFPATHAKSSSGPEKLPSKIENSLLLRKSSLNISVTYRKFGIGSVKNMTLILTV